MPLKVPILCYHRVHRDDDCPPTPHAGAYCGHVSLSAFQRQMQYLAQERFTTVTHRDLAEWLLAGRSLPERAVAVDFDDNRIHVMENACPVMREFGLHATVFVVSQLAEGTDIGGMSHPYGAMGWTELKELESDGWLIAAHTRTHPELAHLMSQPSGPTLVRRELEGSQEEIARRMGKRPLHFAYPVGSWNERVEEIVKDVFETARLWNVSAAPLYNTPSTDPYRLEANNISAHVPFDDFRRILDGACDES